MNVMLVVMRIVSFLAISLPKIYEKEFLVTAIAYFLASKSRVNPIKNRKIKNKKNE